ncbi:MAG: transposase [Candidatus Saccharimonadaceae bacterium]|nr:transposase [Candidatus Saccharimonadaceae bacterium]
MVESMRRIALHGSELARAKCDTIRLKLLKIGAVIIRNTRRVKLLYSSAYPYQGLFIKAAYRLRC